jgi:hypothetical protein
MRFRVRSLVQGRFSNKAEGPLCLLQVVPWQESRHGVLNTTGIQTLMAERPRLAQAK